MSADSKHVMAGAVATPIIAAVTAAAVAAKEKEHALAAENQKEWEAECAAADAQLKRTLPQLKDHAEVGRLEYFVQLALRTTEAWLKTRAGMMVPAGALPTGVWALPISKAHATAWDKRARGLSVVECLIPVPALSAANPLSRIVANGFDFTSTGGFGRFSVGTVDLAGAGITGIGNAKKPGGVVSVEFLYCRLIVGRPYPLSLQSLNTLAAENAGKTHKAVPLIPKGYHSIFVQKTLSAAEEISAAGGDAKALPTGRFDAKLPRAGTLRSELQPGAMDGIASAAATAASAAAGATDGGMVLNYAHEFLLTDPAAVLPVYLIRAEVDTSAVNKRDPKCEACDRADATVYCEQDDAVLCSACDHEVHSANRLVSRHTRMPLQQRLLKENGFCPEHPNKKVEFYCLTCATPVCVWCKMIGNHSGGDAVHHKLTEIFMAYNQARNDSTQPDAVLEKRSEYIKAQMEMIDARMKQVNDNSTAIEQQLFAMLQEVLYRLQEYHQRKLNILVGESLEFGRAMEEMAWAESFLRFQQNNTDPVNFLKGWQRHQQLRARFAANPPPTSVAVAPDIRINGKVDVATASDDSFLQFVSSATAAISLAAANAMSPGANGSAKSRAGKENAGGLASPNAVAAGLTVVMPPGVAAPATPSAGLSAFVESNTGVKNAAVSAASAKLLNRAGHKRGARRLSQMPDETLALRELQMNDPNAAGAAGAQQY